MNCDNFPSESLLHFLPLRGCLQCFFNSFQIMLPYLDSSQKNWSIHPCLNRCAAIGPLRKHPWGSRRTCFKQKSKQNVKSWESSLEHDHLQQNICDPVAPCTLEYFLNQNSHMVSLVDAIVLNKIRCAPLGDCQNTVEFMIWKPC